MHEKFVPDFCCYCFFGYTFCPDICPLTLSDMREVMLTLGDDAEQVAVVFVSVDPERDTPEQLAAYVRAFHESFIGVHIPLTQLDHVKEEYFVFSEKEYPTDEKEGWFKIRFTLLIYRQKSI
ncbi:SCO family protein [Chloroflexi bacterium TSY]|nr:SCO family protein [Chloroflexi bacterium TSY]